MQRRQRFKAMRLRFAKDIDFMVKEKSACNIVLTRSIVLIGAVVGAPCSDAAEAAVLKRCDSVLMKMFNLYQRRSLRVISF
jgi:hypothetical protein